MQTKQKAKTSCIVDLGRIKSNIIFLINFYVIQNIEFYFNYLAKADGNTHGYIGTFKIISGTSFTPALQNRSSADFKVLAFDVEQLVRTYWSLVNSKTFVGTLIS